ncbi:heat-inducible transcriptional repressor HrcA [Alkaliphilus sp. MSJ-5]|uniref:Heat-inducible transcription repressor HrcA n=1 Tax=Alkaliphilus flagellatus TaxID=2841507 RepID=A0ABS6G008_9FIRM|nr:MULTISPECIES: heat-inducible transcriptional repressor HrcA [Alkaliphilus]MBU5675659.1 heat-inducible transcriptional repressor HrcA [Alkaliphilus flagellatus]QUH21121.1 heat-inducible transcription repressor HrcA [Alkaliphilus sp. B6464]
MLNERKLKILQAIIQDYIETAEPVGSRTLSKKYDLGVSPATIRNEMADLEELGFIIQPHTSAGRIPSDKGYRLYVDEFMSLKKMVDIERDYLELDLFNKVAEIEQILQYSSKLLSQLTNYTAVALAPQIKESKLKHIQLVPIDTENMLAVIVTDSGMVKKPIIRLSDQVSKSSFQTMSNFLNDKLHGLAIKNIEASLIEILSEEFINSSSIIDKIIPEIFQSLDEVSHINMFLNGAMNIFNFPEYNDIFKAKSFLELLEEKELLSSLITSFSNEGLSVSIGSENIYKEAKDCSLVTATYKVDNTTLGWLSVIGPTRMDYSTVVSVMAEVSKVISELLKNRYK